MAKIIGIDLGTSTSAVAVLERGQPRILAGAEGRVMPSCVCFDPGGKVRVGSVAWHQRTTNPDYTFTGLKRLLGRQFADPHIQAIAAHVPYDIVAGPNGEAFVRGPDRAYAPEELLSFVVRRLKDGAQTVLAEPVGHAVIGVPAHFDVVQKEAVRRAVRLGGLDPIALVPEPTAAAIAYSMDGNSGKTIAVFDCGGGTFDIAYLKQTGKHFRVLSVAGDPFLGGEDFDARLVDYLADLFRAQHSLDLRSDALALQRVRAAAEAAKIELSALDEFRVFEGFIAKDSTTHSKIDLDETIARADYDELTADLVERMRQPCIDAMAAAKINPRQIDDVVMVGGMTKAPAVLALAADVFGREPRRSINPIEAVALGCAIVAAVRAGDIKSLSMADVTSASFGVEAGGGAFVPLLKRGSSLPSAKTVRTGPYEDGAESVVARIFQGDLRIARDNREVASVVLDGLAPAPAGEVDIDLTLDLDQDGVLTVTLRDVARGVEVSQRVHADTGFDDDALAHLRGLSEDEESAPSDQPRPGDIEPGDADAGEAFDDVAGGDEDLSEDESPTLGDELAADAPASSPAANDGDDDLDAWGDELEELEPPRQRVG